MAKVIAFEARTSTPRGRKANIDSKLLRLLGADKLPADKVLVLDETDGFPATDGPGKVRAAHTNRIRTHWEHAGRQEPVSVVYSPEGFPQVSVNRSKMEKQAEEG